MQSASSSHKIRTNSTQSAPTLPRLPVPKLHLTLQKYLKSIQPFLLEDEARGGPPFESSYNIRVKWAEDFEHGLGQICQERLLALDKASPNNWLDDNFWLKKAYHEWRAPLLINSNWWLALNHDPIIPEDVIYGRAPSRKSGFTEWQVRRASWLVYRLLDFKARLERQELHPDTTRSEPRC
ncbi:Carnitine O-acetyltransferase, mitochondrial [Grifola frondosa]|uniref:Carnitine O-acetyltransferase, mitochondrial n=1 Tax=Grifola frondosa TaxID=5627 RepID=A0A1C7M725_GRIFR|nr:Carnitine O-acetyltransferase, mitochondrial [Grifola frondosa]